MRDPVYADEVPFESAEDYAQAGFFDGPSLKEQGMAAAEAAASPTWRDRWQEAIRTLAALGAPFTSDEVREIAGPPEDHPNAAGSLFHGAARSGLIRQVGYRKSRRDVLHSHPLTEWVGVR